jgi:hypothetical protein
MDYGMIKRNLKFKKSSNSTEIEFITELPCDPKLWSATHVLGLAMDKYMMLWMPIRLSNNISFSPAQASAKEAVNCFNLNASILFPP